MILTLEQVKDWLKEIAAEAAGRIAVGTIDGKAEHFIGVYDGKHPPKQRICLGGYELTRYAQKSVRILLHWSKNAVEAERAALNLWQRISGTSGFEVVSYADGSNVYSGRAIRIVSADAGGGPISVGRDEYGVYEYVINLVITYERKE